LRIGFYNYYDVYNKNKMFVSPSSSLGDNLNYFLWDLGENFKSKGHTISTIDMVNDVSTFDAVIFIDFPTNKNKYFNYLIKNKFENLFLIILEPPMTKNDNFILENHKYFKKIFTWHDDYIDNKKYFKINYSFKIPQNLYLDLNNKNKLCTLIACHKYSNNPIELYSERIKAIKWFEKHHPEDFDLYGVGWSKYIYKGILNNLNKYIILRNVIKNNYSSYKGAILSKHDILKRYKFSICYENERSVPGYITEKIFDCFFAGNVPVYLGCSNIEKYIPTNLFIDKRNFKTYSELYNFMKNITDEQYEKYIKEIERFLKSENIKIFSSEYFSNVIISEVMKSIL